MPGRAGGAWHSDLARIGRASAAEGDWAMRRRIVVGGFLVLAATQIDAAIAQTYQQPYTPPPPPCSAVTPSPLRGAARGAAVGAVGGAIGGNAGKGAAIGAGVGGVASALRRGNARASGACS